MLSSTGTRCGGGSPGGSGRVTTRGKGRTPPGAATGPAGTTKSSGVWFLFAISRSSSKGIFAKAATTAGSKWVSDLLPDFGEGVRVGAGRVVRPVGGQRVVDVDHGEEPRPERDLGAFQLPGVPLPVVPLMMGQDDLGRAAQEFDLPQHPRPHFRVVAHHHPLLLGQRPGLQQHLVGDADLPHVVKEGAAPEDVERVLVPDPASPAPGAACSPPPAGSGPRCCAPARREPPPGPAGCCRSRPRSARRTASAARRSSPKAPPPARRRPLPRPARPGRKPPPARRCRPVPRTRSWRTPWRRRRRARRTTSRREGWGRGRASGSSPGTGSTRKIFRGGSKGRR